MSELPHDAFRSMARTLLVVICVLALLLATFAQN